MSDARALSFTIFVLLIVTVALPRDASAASATENFQRYCVQCHGTEGKGDGVNATKDLPAAPKDLTNREELSRLTDERIAAIITNGGARNELSAIMPPWGETLTAQEIQELVRFVRGLCKCTFHP